MLIDSSKADDSLSKTEKKADGVGKKFLGVAKTVGKMGLAVGTAAIAAGGAMFAMANKSAAAADRLLDLKAITGMSTDEIQRWERVTKIAGVSADAMTNASQKLTKSLDTMAKEGGKGSEALEAIGLSFEEISNMNADERMDAITEALAGVEDTTLRAKIGTDLLGGSWKDIAPIVDMGADAMKEAKANANIVSEDDLNKANDYRVKVELLKDQFGHFAMMLGITVIPIIEKVMEWFSKLIDWTKTWYNDNQEIIETTKQTFTEFFAKVAELFQTFIELVTAFWDRFGSQIVEVIKSNLNTTKAVFSTAFNLITDIFKVFAALFKGDWSGMWQALKDTASNLLSGIKDIFSGTLDTVLTILKNFSLFQVGKDMIQGLINGISSMITKVRDTITNIGSTITNGIKSALKINSPSKVMEEDIAIDGIGAGLFKGLDNVLMRTASPIIESNEQTKKNARKAMTLLQDFKGRFSISLGCA